MSNTTTNADPLADVSSLYGPGTLLGWVCTFISVVITWNFNRDVRDADTLTIDFLVMVAIPIAAAGHVFYLVLYYRATNAQLEPFDPAIARHIAAVEAPLRTCIGFMAMIHFLGMMAAKKRQPKRFVCCSLAGLIVTVGHIPAIDCTKWAPGHWLPSTIFIFTSASVATVGVAGVIDQVQLLVLQRHPAALGYHDVGRLNIVATTGGGEPRPGFACAAHWRRGGKCESCEDCREEVEVVRWARHKVSRALFIPTAALVWPMSFLVSFGIICFITGEPFNPAPESPNNILELDQAVALFIGLVTVWRTLREAVHSHQGGRGVTCDMKPQVEVAKDILRMYSEDDLDTLVSRMPLPQSAAIRSGWGAWLRRTVHRI